MVMSLKTTHVTQTNQLGCSSNSTNDVGVQHRLMMSRDQPNLFSLEINYIYAENARNGYALFYRSKKLSLEK